MAWSWPLGRRELVVVRTSLAVSLGALPGIVLWSVNVAALCLIILTLGIPLSLRVTRFVRGYADRYRRWAGEFTGSEIARPYRPAPAGGGWMTDFRHVYRDPATWRDLAWLCFNATVGLTLALLPAALLLSTLWHLSVPVQHLAFGAGALRLDYGLFLIHDLPTSLLALLPAAAAVLLLRLTGRPILLLHARVTRWFLAPTARARLDRRLAKVTESRSAAVDSQAAELRRIQRDLHDGAQARMVSLGISIGMADKLIASDPEAASALLEEAMRSNTTALAELRGLVRGIHPPVLADRGLAVAVEAIALASAVPVTTSVSLPGRAPAPVESAMYFAVAEAVANLVKHGRATQAWITMEYRGGALRVAVGDNGRGGAEIREGGGMAGIERRLSAFDGILVVTSPPGGPTTVTMELPCALSSEKT